MVCPTADTSAKMPILAFVIIASVRAECATFSSHGSNNPNWMVLLCRYTTLAYGWNPDYKVHVRFQNFSESMTEQDKDDAEAAVKFAINVRWTIKQLLSTVFFCATKIWSA